MKSPPPLDGRLARQLEAELHRRAIALRGEDAGAMPVGPIEQAIYAVAARIGEEVTTRLDKVPAKQADNFYTAAGLGRDPARAASLPIAFKLTDTARETISAPAGTQVLTSGSEPVIFETAQRIDLVPGKIEALRGVDAGDDRVTKPAEATLAPQLPGQPPLVRRLRAAASVGADKLQLNPPTGLHPGALLSFGIGTGARHHLLTKIEDDLATIEPPLEVALAADTPVAEVLCFAPFGEATRNHQQHALYLAHATLLDTPSAVALKIAGIDLPEGAQWEWWGTQSDGEQPAWHALAPSAAQGTYTKPAGKPQKTKINGQESFWVRARLPGQSSGATEARDVTLAVVGEGCSGNGVEAACEIAESVQFDAVAANVPAVTNKPFHPFGREPRLYDSFHVSSKEAFPKSGASVAMAFDFGGAALGQMAAISNGDAAELFGVGTDGLLYRARTSTTGGDTLLPLPRQDKTALLAKAPVVALQLQQELHVAVAGKGRIDVASLAVGSLLTPDRVKWKGYELPTATETAISAIVPQVRNGLPGIVVQTDKGLFRCVLGGAVERVVFAEDPADPQSASLPVLALTAVTGTDSLLVVTPTSSANQTPVFRRIGAADADDAILDIDEPENLPLDGLAAWSQADLGEPVFIAGFDQDKLLLHSIAEDGSDLKQLYPDNADGDTGYPAPRSLHFVAPREGRFLRPSLLIASTRGTGTRLDWIVPVDSDFRKIPDPGSESGDIALGAVPAVAEGWLAVQHGDVGVLLRSMTNPAGVERLSFSFNRHGILLPSDPQLPDQVFAVAEDANGGHPHFYGFEDLQPGEPGRRASRMSGPVTVTTPNHFAADLKTLAFASHDECTIVSQSNLWRIQLDSGDFVKWSDSTSRAFAWIPYSTTPGGLDDAIFMFEPPSSGSQTKNWQIKGTPPSSPLPAGCRLLTIRSGDEFNLFDALQLLSAQEPYYAAKLRSGKLRALVHSDYVMQPPVPVGGVGMVLAPAGSVETARNLLETVADPQTWRRIGPDQPANPALSWEYWNGSAWWALDDDDFVDSTGHFQTSGCVRFTVPADIQPTEVSGKRGHWIRARLIGGDYGEARTTVVPLPEAQGGGHETKRDVSAIRAPFAVSLKVAYCAHEPTLPEIVFTHDSLGFVDQTSANQAGVAFRAFVPLAETMSPPVPARPGAQDQAKSQGCDDFCPEDAPPQPDPCTAPGAYDSCDSTCIRAPGQPRIPGQADPDLTRGLLVGFDKRFSGDPVSIYVMAEPSGSPVKLRADIFRDGRFVPVQVVSDTSYGLTEPGVLTLSIQAPPDETGMMGETSHWLRLWPEGDASQWSPQICGLYLNAVMASSLETRTMERLGASDGTPDQSFRLAEVPVDPGSLVVRVREQLSQQERDGTDIASYRQGPPGEWVLWRRVPDFAVNGAPGRVFTFDADRGELRFGDGKTGTIPPLGAEVLVERYARVRGKLANGVKAGDKPTLLASLAGVDTVLALDYSAGGSDVEATQQARRRAAAKLRHGNCILTAADLADYVPTLDPDIAQVRVIDAGRTTRIVVALAGSEVLPLPAKLRAIEGAVRQVSGYGLRRPDGVVAIAPRLLSVSLSIALVPRDTESFAEAAELAKQLVTALFDPATGGLHERGWPIGRLPASQDIAAALAPIGDLAFPAEIELRRADRPDGEDRLPQRLPPDVLVRLDLAATRILRAQELVS